MKRKLILWYLQKLVYIFKIAVKSIFFSWGLLFLGFLIQKKNPLKEIIKLDGEQFFYITTVGALFLMIMFFAIKAYFIIKTYKGEKI